MPDVAKAELAQSFWTGHKAFPALQRPRPAKT